jgi:hypothetical protein
MFEPVTWRKRCHTVTSEPAYAGLPAIMKTEQGVPGMPLKGDASETGEVPAFGGAVEEGPGLDRGSPML